MRGLFIMNENDIKIKIINDLDEITESKVEIQKLIVEPSLVKFEALEGGDCDLWIVGRKEEYFIVFDEKTGNFGLAFKNIVNLMVFLGLDGTLFDAYQMLISREEPSNRKALKNKKFDKKDNPRRVRRD